MNDQHEWRNRTVFGFRLDDINESCDGWVCTKCKFIVETMARPRADTKINIDWQRMDLTRPEDWQQVDLTCSEIQVLRLLNE